MEGSGGGGIGIGAAGASAAGAGSSSTMASPVASGSANYFNLNSLIATPTSNTSPIAAQSTSPISSSIILATSGGGGTTNHIHGNLLFDSGNNQCANSPTILHTNAHLTHLTSGHNPHHNQHPHHHPASAYQSHHHHLHYHAQQHSMQHHMSPHHPHLATPPHSTLVMTAGPPQSPTAAGPTTGLMLHQTDTGEQQFHPNYLTAKMESPGGGGATHQQIDITDAQQRSQQQQQSGSMMLGNSYSM